MMPTAKFSIRGFSLIEIAIVILIISILATMVAIPMSEQRRMQHVKDTQKQLETIQEALYSFAMANGRLPCPALNSGVCNTGRECFCTEQSVTMGACTKTITKPPPYTGRCAAFGTTTTALEVGFLPAADLGIAPTNQSAYALDGYNTELNLIYYAVARAPVGGIGGIDFPLTADDGIKSATMGIMSASSFLTICPSTILACTTANSINSKAPFILLSLGANAATPFASLSAKEQANLDNDISHRFVQDIPSQDFDDILLGSSLNTLFGRMMQAGRLP